MNDGQFVFGVWNNQTETIETPNVYNDGQWHYVVATYNARTTGAMALYVDGQLIGTNTTSSAQTYSGYWRVGGDNLNGWNLDPWGSNSQGTTQPHSYYFNGTIGRRRGVPDRAVGGSGRCALRRAGLSRRRSGGVEHIASERASRGGHRIGQFPVRNAPRQPERARERGRRSGWRAAVITAASVLAVGVTVAVLASVPRGRDSPAAPIAWQGATSRFRGILAGARPRCVARGFGSSPRWSPGPALSKRPSTFEREIGRTLAINNLYMSWKGPMPSAARWDLARGTIPMISWAGTRADQGSCR